MRGVCLTATRSAENREGSLRPLGALHGAFSTSKRAKISVKHGELLPPAIDTAGGGQFVSGGV